MSRKTIFYTIFILSILVGVILTSLSFVTSQFSNNHTVKDEIVPQFDLTGQLILQKPQQSLISTSLNEFQNHAPIRIRSLEDFHALGFPGEGTLTNPFTITGLNITSTDDRLLDIQNIKVHVVISNNRLQGLALSSYGIILSNVANITVINNVIQQNLKHGLRINSAQDILVKDNWIVDHGASGILLHDAADLTFDGNFVSNNGRHGIWIRGNVEDSTLKNNIFRDNARYGVLLGYGYPGEQPTSSDNTIIRNSFRDNKLNSSQAGDYGTGSIFNNNFWRDWSFQHFRENETIDVPYPIDSINASSLDTSPLANEANPSQILPALIFYPDINDNLMGSVKVEWLPALDSRGSSLSYTLSFSSDAEQTWEVLVSNINTTFYIWDTDSYPENTAGVLKVVTSNFVGQSESSPISGEFSIRKPDFLILIENFLAGDIAPLLALGFLLVVTVVLAVFYIKKRYSRSSSFKRFITSFNEDYVRQIYHKLIIGLENVRVELLSQSQSETQSKPQTQTQSSSFSPIDPAEYAVIGNIFPAEIQNDLKSIIKGRTVLILIEMAYQQLEKSNTSFLAKVLNIPQQTVFDDVKRLLKMEYIQPQISITTLVDSRKKNYALTHKGLVFLHLLKESLTSTFTKMRQAEN